ncbi:VOC family protein [Tessaracoccus coleopterorum]|uniref:VOC family protein n=1 Tax=Tessaracoccus coleopterorum TaxID=2714950 RepID=UPI0018D29E35|nr:VOC family protein [Tessaracoccus coleopterorum]
MSILLNPYLALDGTCREAMEFYRFLLGGELSVMTFGEAQGGAQFPGSDRVMHASLTTDDGMVIFGSDTMDGMPQTVGDTVAMSISGSDERLPSFHAGLAEGGAVLVPFEKQMWGTPMAWSVTGSACSGT